jgi:hypothetical protein
MVFLKVGQPITKPGHGWQKFTVIAVDLRGITVSVGIDN